jgi:hypothetical protein
VINCTAFVWFSRRNWIAPAIPASSLDSIPALEEMNAIGDLRRMRGIALRVIRDEDFYFAFNLVPSDGSAVPDRSAAASLSSRCGESGHPVLRLTSNARDARRFAAPASKSFQEHPYT